MLVLSEPTLRGMSFGHASATGWRFASTFDAGEGDHARGATAWTLRFPVPPFSVRGNTELRDAGCGTAQITRPTRTAMAVAVTDTRCGAKAAGRARVGRLLCASVLGGAGRIEAFPRIGAMCRGETGHTDAAAAVGSRSRAIGIRLHLSIAAALCQLVVVGTNCRASNAHVAFAVRFVAEFLAGAIPTCYRAIGSA